MVKGHPNRRSARVAPDGGPAQSLSGPLIAERARHQGSDLPGNGTSHTTTKNIIDRALRTGAPHYVTNVLILGNFSPSRDGVSVQMEYIHSWFGSGGPVQTQIFSTSSRGLWRIFDLAGLLHKARHFDVINAHTYSYEGFWPAILGHFASRTFRKRLVIVFHGAAAQEFFDKVPARRQFLHSNPPIVVPSGFLASVFASYGVETTIIPNAIDLDKFNFKARKTLRPHLITTRNLSTLYNVKAGIETLALLQKQHPEARLTIVGTGSRQPELEQQVRDRALEGVTFLGRIRNAEVASVLAEHDIFINTSLEDNLPVSVLEAFASGLPVVSTNVGGIPYLVTDKQTGLLVRPNDPAEMAAKILWMLENQEEALAMAMAARRTLQIYDGRVLREKWRHHFETPVSSAARRWPLHGIHEEGLLLWQLLGQIFTDG